MLNIKKIILLTAISLTIAACGSTYKRAAWTNSVAESDWDIDSAICLQKSQKLNKSDLERVNQIKSESDEMKQVLQHNAQQSGGSDAANVINVLGAMFAESTKATAEDSVKDEKFEKCLKNKGWGKGKKKS